MLDDDTRAQLTATVANLRGLLAGTSDETIAVALVIAVRELEAVLHGRAESATIGTMQAEAEARARSGRPVESEHPFPRKLEETGSSVQEWADANGLSRKKVSSWYSPKPYGRAIPRKFAAKIARTLGIPAEEAYWPNGIRE